MLVSASGRSLGTSIAFSGSCIVGMVHNRRGWFARLKYNAHCEPRIRRRVEPFGEIFSVAILATSLMKFSRVRKNADNPDIRL